MKLYYWFLILLFLSSSYEVLNQQVQSSKTKPSMPHYEIDGSIGNTHVPEGNRRDSNGNLILLNIGYNLKYWFDESFANGWYNNMAVRTFVIDSDTHQELDRKCSFITSVAGKFKSWKNVSFVAGHGVAIQKNQSLFTLRKGIDYAYSILYDWHLTPRFIFDQIGGNIEACTLGTSIGRKF